MVCVDHRGFIVRGHQALKAKGSRPGVKTDGKSPRFPWSCTSPFLREWAGAPSQTPLGRASSGGQLRSQESCECPQLCMSSKGGCSQCLRAGGCGSEGLKEAPPNPQTLHAQLKPFPVQLGTLSPERVMCFPRVTQQIKVEQGLIFSFY